MTGTDGGDHRSRRASVEAVFREERGRLLAALVRRFGDLDLAEEVTSEAIEAALVHWPVDGVPPKPGAWLMTTARRKAVDRLRRDQAYAARLAVLQVEADRARHRPPAPDGDLPDERLQLFFTCAHPALPAEDRDGADPALPRRADHAGGRARVPRADARRWRSGSCGRRTEDPRRRGSRSACRPPTSCPSGCPACSRSSTRSSPRGTRPAPAPDLQRLDLAEEAIRLARILRRLLPGEREVAGLLALMLLIHARRDARTGPDGELVLLDDQDRARWDRTMIEEGRALVVDRADRRPARPVRRAGGDRRAARRGRRRREHRLAADRGALRRAARARAVAGGRAEPGGGGGACATGRRPGWRCSTTWPTSRGCAATTRTDRPEPTCCDASAAPPRPPTAYQEALAPGRHRAGARVLRRRRRLQSDSTPG